MHFADTVAGRLERHCIQQPEHPAFTWLPDGEHAQETLTWAELRGRVAAVAAHLQDRQLEGERVLLLHHSGLEFVCALLGCLYAGAVPVPCPPWQGARAGKRLQAIARSARPRLLLTDRVALDPRTPVLLDREGVAVLASDTMRDGQQEWQPPHLDAGVLALLQYTSGSTRTPRGVMISHANLVDNETRIRDAFGQDHASIVVSWLPLHHDMGLIGTILQPVFVGARAVLMPPARFVERPIRWLRAIDRYQATTSGGPNFSYDLCARRATDEELATLDLSRWRVAFNGAEPILADTLQRFAHRFADCGFRASAFAPCYGLAEATLFATGGVAANGPVVEQCSRLALAERREAVAASDAADTRALVACGTAGEGIRIVDPDGGVACSEGIVGEIWIRTPSTALGYYGEAEETSRTFEASLQGSDGVFLRTGDLGFVSSGRLFVTGRLKDLIIIHGRNHDPHDVEISIARLVNGRLRGVAAIPLQRAGREAMAIVAETGHAAASEHERLIQEIRHAVAAEHDVTPEVVALVPVGALPRTTSGKLRRGACRAALEAGELPFLTRWQENVDTMPPAGDVDDHAPASGAADRDALEALIGRALGRSRVPPDGPLVRYGLDSLKAAWLAYEIDQRWSLTIEPLELLHGLSLMDLHARLHAPRQAREVVGQTEHAASESGPLSVGQQALWFRQRVAPGDSSANIAVAARVRGSLDLERFTRTVHRVVEMHPMLNARFTEDRGEPRQRLGVNPLPTVLHRQLADSASIAEILNEEASRPFSLVDEGPLRLVLVQPASGPLHLLFVVHHIAIDLWSCALLLKDIAHLYAGGEPRDTAESTGGYLRFVERQRAVAADGSAEPLLAFWRQILQDAPPPIEFSRVGTTLPRWRGSRHRAIIDNQISRQLATLARTHDTTPFVVALSAYVAWLHGTFDRADLIIGSPAHGRSATDAQTIGYFANLLPLRCQIASNDSFEQVIARVKRTVNDAVSHQALPFSLMVEQFAGSRKLLDTPWIQTVFVWHDSPDADSATLGAFALGASGAALTLGDTILEAVPLERAAVEFDLTMTLAPYDEGVAVALDVRDASISPADAARYLAAFLENLDAVTSAPTRRVTEPHLPPREVSGQHSGGAPSGSALRNRTALHHRFEEQASRQPQSIAVRCDGDTLTYAELDTRANRLARYIRRHERGPEALVGIHLERSTDLAVAILGVLKANCAYLPLDVQAPPERTASLLGAAGARLLVTTRVLADRLGTTAAMPLLLDVNHDEIDQEMDTPLDLALHSEQLAYCIYTSGSTGRPKGVLINHRHVLGLFAATSERFGFSAEDVWTLFHSPAFDFSVWEFWGALLHGAELVIVPYSVSRDPRAFGELLVRRGVTVLSQTPTAFRTLVPELVAARQAAPLRLIVFGGEALIPTDLRPWVSRFGVERPRLVNMYGITETTVHVTAHVLTAEEIFGGVESVIGDAIDGWRIYLVEHGWQEPAPGTVGEMYVAGVGVARGYLGDPALTATRFVPDPFAGTSGARMYRSGDLATRDRAGRLVYAGRADHQVKIRGFRIELGEIESVIRQQPGVLDAAVLLHAAAADDATVTEHVAIRDSRRYLKHGVAERNLPGGLMAFVVVAPTGGPDEASLLTRLRQLLPDYMVPARVISVAGLPTTVNGKLDRAGLLASPRTVAVAHGAYVPPDDDVEAALADVWAHVLKLPRVSVQDNYFTLGGDSIRALRVVALAAERGIQFDVASLFACQTIRDLRRRARIASATDGQAESMEPLRTAPFSLVAPADRALLPDTVLDAYPLSRMQAGLIYHGTDHPATSVYRASFLYNIDGRLDEMPLRAALQQVVDRHPILRTSFDLARFSEPLQIVHATCAAPLTSTDLCGYTPAERDRHVDEWLDSERLRDFDLTTPPLFRAHAFRLDHQRFAIGLTCHDALLDGWSTAILLTEWLTGYDASLAHAPASTAPSPTVTYRDFVAAERRARSEPAHAAFWDNRLQGCTPLRVPGVHASPLGPPRLRVLDLPVPRAVRDGLLAVSRQAGVALKHVLLAAHVRVLAVTSGVWDIVTGLEANGRVEWSDGERAVGQHLNTLPFRLALPGGTWLELIRATFDREREMLLHRRFPYADIQRRRGRQALYDTTFNYTHFHVFRSLATLTHVRPVSGHGRELTHYVLKTELNRDAFTDDISLDIIFDASRIPEERVSPIGHRYLAALAAIATSPHQRYEDDPLLTVDERERIAMFATGDVVPRDAGGLPDLIAAQTARTPDHTAVSFRDHRLTYRELDARAAALASRLRALGVSVESRVGIFMERSLELPVALLATLKAGGAYVPLDPDYPDERLVYMARDARLAVILTEPLLRGRLPVHDVPALDVTDGSHHDADAERAEAGASSSTIATHPEQAAYVIYTSGSTGRPKGSVNTHRAVVNRLRWMADAYGFAPGDRILQKTPYSFDVSVWELFAPLMVGAELVMAEPGGHRDPDYLTGVVTSRAITVLHFVPSMLPLFLEAPAARQCTSLRLIVCSGEALAASLCRRVHSTLNAALHNLYGPTEAAVDVSAWACTDPASERVSIGRPIANTTIHILDGHGQPVAPLVPGELYIGGMAPGRGYLGAAPLTAERFVPDPFSTRPGGRLYRTGDLARFLVDGNIEYLGRVDTQVKVNGIRIELGEIESVIRLHPAVRDCAVAVTEGSVAPSLCAYLVSRGGEPCSDETLRSWVTAKLPLAMTPAWWTWLDALPLTPSGKLDRRALPPPDTTRHRDASLASAIDHVAGLSDAEVQEWLQRAMSDGALPLDSKTTS